MNLWPANIFANKIAVNVTIVLALALFCHSQASAQLEGYSFRKQLTIDDSKVSGTADLIDFPALISITDTDLRTILNGGDVTSDNGYDIAFTAADGVTELEHDLESFDGTTGTYLAWVKIPTLSYNTGTNIYIYYGNASVTTDPSSTGTWDSNYQGVWHLNENVTDGVTGGSHDDATTSANDGLQIGNSPVSGKINNAQFFDIADNDRIEAGAPTIANALTISGWINQSNVSAIRNRYVSLANDFVMRHDGPVGVGQLHFYIEDNSGTKYHLRQNSAISAGTWHYIVGTYDGNTQRLYLDGSEVQSQVLGVSLQSVSIPTLFSQASETMDGSIDEPRVSDIARSADWIATEYTNQNDPANFLLAAGTGPEEPTSTPGNVSSNLIIWLKADAGVLNPPGVSAWADQTGLSNAVAVASGDPQLLTESLNFNPTIELDGTGDYFETITNSIIGDNNPYTKYAVIISDDITTQRQIISSDGSGNLEMSHGGTGNIQAEHNGNALFSGSSTLTQGSASIVGIRYGAGGLDNFARLDGVATIDNTTQSFTDAGAIQIGAYNGSAPELMDGQIAEVVITDDELSDADVTKLESYLAIKYGITLNNTAGNYIASDGSTVLWNATSNSTYHNDIAGIGRDDDTGLDQQKSISSHSDAIVIMDKGASFSNDLDYILWGNNDGSATMSTSGATGAFTNILGRRWRAAVTGSPGTVTVRLIFSNTGTATDYGLHVDSDGDFTSGSINYTGSSISGDTITFENVSISNGNYFTFGSGRQEGAGPRGPGGIGDTDGTSSLTLWLDAGKITGIADGADITGWSDLSGYGNNAAVGTAPNYTTSWGGNGQPAVAFTAGSSEYLSLTANSQVKPTTALSVFIAGNFDSGSDTYGSLINTASDNLWEDGWGIAEESTTALQYFTDWNDPYGQTRLSLNAGVDDQKHVYGMVHASGTSTAFEDGSTGTFSPSTLTYKNPNDEVLIGAGPNVSAAAYFMTGEIAEVILYDADLNLAQQIILNNYLAAKYDIAIANDVYQQDNNGFDFDVAGIGQASDDSNHTDAQGTGIVRMLNPTDLGTDEFLIWGHDNGRMEAYETTDVPSGVAARLTGQWRVSELNASLTSVDVGSVDIVFDLSGLGEINASDLVLLVDTNNDGFADETAITGASYQVEDYYMFTGVTALADGYQFTIGTADRSQTPLISGAFGSDGPGGVGSTDGSSSLVMWLDAGSLSAGPVTTWSDQSGYGNDALVDSYGSPGFNATGMSNSQPAVTFTQANSENLYIPGNSQILPTDALSVFVVGNYVDGTSENNAGFLCAFNDGGRDDGWAIKQDAGNLNMQFWLDDQATNVCTKAFTSGADEIWGLMFDGSTGSGYMSEDSCGYSFAGPITYATGKNDDLLIGVTPWNSGPSYFMEGEIGEIIEFNTAVNDAQRIIISNYLSAKYAIALSAYDVYNEDDLGYDFEVAGIGQSAGGDTHTDAQGSGIIRMLNPASLSNGAFLMWGHDNGALTDTETADVPGTVHRRLERIWAVSETIDVGSVDLMVDLSSLGVEDAGLVRLLVDTNGGGFSDATVISGATALSNNIFLFGGTTDLADNARFTIALMRPGPGSVTTDLQVWLKSDEGTVGGATITGWSDQSGNSNDADNATGNPEYLENIINYNPAIDFDGVSDYLSTTATSIIGNDGDYTKYAVIVPHDISTNQSIVGSDGSGNHRLRLTNGGWVTPQHASIQMNNMSGFVVDQAHLAGFRYDGAANVTCIDGRSTTTGGAATFTDAGAVEIGGYGSGSDLLDGYVAEVIVYNAKKDDNEAAQIESYLAMKYGITLDDTYGGTAGDYVASNASTVWDADLNTAYHNDVIAIGRDDNSALYQRQSRTQDDSLRVYIGTLSGDNASNGASISNDVSYLVIGHNGGVLKSDGAIDTEAPTGITSRMVREWKITNTNFIDEYALEFEWEEVGPFNIADIRLLVDADGDFSNATIYGPADGLTFTEGSIIVSGINTTHIAADGTSYITLASVNMGTTLPIELVSFQAEVVENGRAVQLDWSTASETNNDFFTIERSQDTDDWEGIMLIPGAGNSSSRLDYTVFDERPLYGLSYYRLRQTDFDGTYSYSNTVPVTLGEFDDRLTIYPNPTQDRIHVQGSPEELRAIKVFDSQGRNVTSQVRYAKRDTNSVVIDVSKLPIGIYNILTATKSIKMVKSP